MTEGTERVWSAELLSGVVDQIDEKLYLTTPSGNTSRYFWVVGTIIGKIYAEETEDNQAYCEIRLCDGKGVIEVRFWSDQAKRVGKMEEGDIVSTTGIIKKNDTRIYISGKGAIQVGIEDEMLHRLRIIQQAKVSGKESLGIIPQKASNEITRKVRKEILDLLDTQVGKFGLSLSQIMEAINADSELVEEVLIGLLVDGLLYEPEKNKYKRV